MSLVKVRNLLKEAREETALAREKISSSDPAALQLVEEIENTIADLECLIILRLFTKEEARIAANHSRGVGQPAPEEQRHLQGENPSRD